MATTAGGVEWKKSEGGEGGGGDGEVALFYAGKCETKDDEMRISVAEIYRTIHAYR